MNIENLELPKDNNAELRYWMKEAIEMLEDCFGIDNLSTNELFIIKKITEDVVKRVERNNTKDTDLALINSRQEICARFLQEAYGIDFYHMKVNTKSEHDIEGFREYIRRTRERAHLI